MTEAPAHLEQLPSKLEIQALKCRTDFAYFIRQAWSQIESNEISWNWHLDLKADRLQRVTKRDIQKLVIMEPPGFAKSLVVSVMWPAWEWLKRPWERSQYYSGSNSVRMRDSRRCRNLLKSDWYQRTKKVLGLDWQFAEDQDEKGHFANTAGGERQSGVIGGKVTGDRADKQVVDDPYDVKEATRGTPETIKKRMRQVVRDWDDVLVDRLNDEKNDPRVLIMQRLHKSDLAGVLRDREGYEVVEIRQEYDPDAKIQHPGFDPRTEEGELAHPERLDRESVDERKRASNYEATNNQNPQSSSGSIFNPLWFYTSPKQEVLDQSILYDSIPPIRAFDFIATSWDFAGGTSTEAGSWDVGHVYGKRGPKYWVLPWMRRKQASYLQKKEMFDSLADESGVDKHLIELKSSGEQLYNEKSAEVGGCIDFNPTAYGSKTTRAQISTEPIETGDIYLPSPHIAPWIHDWIDELIDGIGGDDDRIDTWSQFVIYTNERNKSDSDPMTTLKAMS
jgi:hypothetical protein